MERLPRWPLAVGLVLWSIAGYVAYTGVWWPLVVIAVVSLLPGLGIGAMALFTRRMKRDATALAGPIAAAPGSAGAIAEPPTARVSGVRTNAKNAGRKRGGGATASLVLFAGVLASEGCERIERARSERRARETAEDGGGPVEIGAPTDGDTPAGNSKDPAPAVAVDPALERTLAVSITPPAAGEASWRVDPFVAALVFERVRAGSLPFTKLDAPIPEGPTAGFRVGEVATDSLLHRLGLRTGDVIEAIGGVVLTDASRIGFALDGAQNRVDVTVFRDGMSVVHSYQLSEGLAWKGVLSSFTGDATIVAARDDGTTIGSPADPAIGDPPGIDPDPTGGAPASGGSKPSSGGSTPSGGTKPSGGGTTPSGGTKPSGGTTPSSGTDPVQCESSSRCTVKKAYFDKMVGSPSALQSQATIVPAIANDVHSGYKLKTVKAGSAVHKLGFRSGDKITHINGKDLTDEMQAAALYLGMSGTSVFKIRFERGGSSQVKTVVVD